MGWRSKATLAAGDAEVSHGWESLYGTYLERAVFELHPANKDPYEGLLSLRGCPTTTGSNPKAAPARCPTTPRTECSSAEGKRLGGKFMGTEDASAGCRNRLPISNGSPKRATSTAKNTRAASTSAAVFECTREKAGTRMRCCEPVALPVQGPL